MNFGYLITVSTNKSADYLKMAYALALSIKNTQKEGYDKVALVIDDKKLIDNLKSSWVFDKIIEWNQETFWDGRAWMDLLTPWEHTVGLDADMLFFRDYSHWIDYLIDNEELYIASKSYTYRSELITNDYYRKTFTENQLPNLYSFFTFFKIPSDSVTEFFSLSRYMTKNQMEFKNHFLNKNIPKILGTDEIFALSSKILGIDDKISYDLEFPKVVHMKGMIQNWPWPAEQWTDHLGFYFNNRGNLKIGNYRQDDIVHYVDKNLITDEIISILERLAWKQ
jgi:hypothetical protein